MASVTKINRYIGRTVGAAIGVVLFVLLSLESISVLVNQLDDLSDNYTFLEAAVFVGLNVPSNLYDNLPMSALVGALVGLGMIASTSELVVIRAAGVSVFQIVLAVMRPVFLYIIAAVLIGEYVAPYTDQYADSRQALAKGNKQSLEEGRGVWNREGNEFMHFNAVLPNGKLFGITRHKLSDSKELIEASFVESAIYQGDSWFETGISVTRFGAQGVTTEYLDTRKWETAVSPDLLNVLVLNAEELPMKRLYDYANYLDNQDLDSREYKLAFWQKAFQPLAMISLVVVAISFILGSLRQTTMGYRVFIGVLVGLVFQTSQKMLGPTSIIWGFSPMLAVLIPILICFFAGVFLIRKA